MGKTRFYMVSVFSLIFYPFMGDYLIGFTVAEYTLLVKAMLVATVVLPIAIPCASSARSPWKFMFYCLFAHAYSLCFILLHCLLFSPEEDSARIFGATYGLIAGLVMIGMIYYFSRIPDENSQIDNVSPPA